MTWLLKDETSDTGSEALKITAETGAIAPALFFYELQNAALVAVRRGRLTLSDAQSGVIYLLNLRIEILATTEHGDLMQLAHRYGISGYDAGYLDLAIRRSLPLASIDKQLCKAAEAEGVSLI